VSVAEETQAQATTPENLMQGVENFIALKNFFEKRTAST